MLNIIKKSNVVNNIQKTFRHKAFDNFCSKVVSAISALAATAEGVQVVEEIMKLTKDSNMPTSNTQVDAQATQDDLKAMLNDPRYWDSSKRDPGYVRRVTELYEKAYKGQS